MGVQRKGALLKCVQPKHLRDDEAVETAFHNQPKSLQHAEIGPVVRLVHQDGLRLQYAGKFRKDRKVCSSALMQNGAAKQFVHGSLHDELYRLSIGKYEHFDFKGI